MKNASSVTFRELIFIIVVFLLIGASLGCDNSINANNQTKKSIIMGASPGPYNDLFNDAIKPELEAEGYRVKLVDFPHLLESDIALSDGSIDLTVAQHTAYMNVFNQQSNANLKSVVHVPSVPAALFSDKHTSLNKVFSGAKVGIPQDESNAARSYNLLEKAGWIKLKSGVDPILANRHDIAENSANIEIIEMDSANIPRVMDELDFAVIPGSIVYSANIDANKALLTETIIPDLEIMVVVNQGNENSQWAEDIKRLYQSDKFKAYMETHNQNGYWVMPQE
ncbi:MetQ/NlpA family ABC transporter substrate-binding protein [Orbaceae bacterium ESL0721]|nr:MetQ/NlpA family ABC transporter substrate-binding protein [Orbaceae bacterium ESL0721]